MQPILVQYRRTIWSERKVDRGFECGITLKEIVDQFEDKPLEFETYGGVFLTRQDGKDGCYIHRKHWHRIKPKAGMKIYVSLVPHGGGMGGGGGTGKQVFMVVAAVALLVLTAGTASVLVTLGASTFYASLGAGAVALGGGLLLQTLNKPSVGKETAVANTGSGATGPTLGTAGIAQNPIVAWAQIPCIKGKFRGSPPVLSKPYVLIDKTDQVAHVIVGYAGHYNISDILINDTAIGDFAAGVIEYETKSGLLTDTELDLITESVFEENINQELVKHRLHADQETLIEPAAQSYPRPTFMKTANNTDRFRVILTMPTGMGRIDVEGGGAVNFRIRFRKYTNGVAGTWIRMPELIMEGNVKAAFRQQLWVYWGAAGDETETMEPIVFDATTENYDPYFIGLYTSTAEWTANSYFSLSGTTLNANHTYLTNDGVYFYLSEETFPKGQYEFEITRSFMRDDSAISGSINGGGGAAYSAGRFTSTGGVAVTAETIPEGQENFLNSIVTQSYASFRSQYPIRRKGLALIAIKARNIQIQSISALFNSQVTVGAGMQYSSYSTSLPVEELLYNFTAAADGGAALHGWTSRQGSGGPASVASSSSGMIYKDNSATDPGFNKTVSFLGSFVDRIYIDIETVALGGGASATVYALVSTGGFMIKTFTLPAVGQRQVFELNMTTATPSGGASGTWTSKTYTGIRFDNENAGGGHFIIRSVRAVKISVGNTTTPSNNPAHHFYDIMTGELNARPVPQSRIDDLNSWASHCYDEALTINRVIESGTTEDALVNAATCGDAALRRSDRYGVVVDKDRTDEDSVGLVSPHIMVSPLVVTIRFLTAAKGLLPSYHDASNDYAVKEFDSPIFDDGITISETSLVESTAYDGLTNEFLVRRRALRDLRAQRIRNKVYSFSLEAKMIDFRKGDKIGLAHDIILQSWASGRVQSLVTLGPNLRFITMNTETVDLPSNPSVNDFFLVADVFLLENVFVILDGYGIGAHVELDDGSVVTIPIANAAGATLEVSGTFPMPAGLAAGALVNVGPSTRESRDVIVTNIQPETGLRAKIECVDLGAEIYRNLAA